MAGICLCQHEGCVKSNKCKRYLNSKEADQYSSYADFKNVCNEESKYQYFWKIESEVKNE